MKNWKLSAKWSNRFDLLVFAYIGSLIEKHYPGFIDDNWVITAVLFIAIMGINTTVSNIRNKG